MTASPEAAIILFFWRESELAILAFFVPLNLCRGMFPKTSLPRFYYADMHGYYAGFDGFFLPHFYHRLYNSLIINKLNSLHRKVASRFPSISINHKKTVRRSLWAPFIVSVSNGACRFWPSRTHFLYPICTSPLFFAFTRVRGSGVLSRWCTTVHDDAHYWLIDRTP